MATVTASDGARLAYDVMGSGATDVLFLHGAAGSGAYFRELIDELDLTRIRAIVADIRGHGDSGGEEAGYTLEGLSADALTIADATSTRDVVVLGFSMGAKFALHLALTAPDRVAALILVAGCPAAEIPVPAEVLEDWYDRTGDADRLAELVTAYTINPVDPAALDRFAQNAARISRAAFEGSLTVTCESSFAAEVGAVDVPTIVVGGTGDALFTPDYLRQGVVDSLPRARLALLSAGHEIPLEKPAELAAIVEGFLAGLGR
jgi:pimeloyl-ACP methyl ester carboxylesterase